MERQPGAKGGEASLRSEKVSAARLQVYLKGIHYPASKQQLMSHAKSNNAPDNVLAFFRRFPEKAYNKPTEVEQEFGKIK